MQSTGTCCSYNPLICLKHNVEPENHNFRLGVMCGIALWIRKVGLRDQHDQGYMGKCSLLPPPPIGSSNAGFAWQSLKLFSLTLVPWLVTLGSRVEERRSTCCLVPHDGSGKALSLSISLDLLLKTQFCLELQEWVKAEHGNTMQHPSNKSKKNEDELR